MNIKKILIPIDGSDRSLDAIHMVETLFSDSTNLEIHLLNIVEITYITQEDLQQQLLTVSDGILDDAEKLLDGHNVIKVSLVGKPYQLITEYVDKENLDMIVMTRMGLSGLQRYLVGSVTSRVISHSNVPVLVVPESI